MEMFGDPLRNEKGWDTAPLAQVTIKIGSGATPKGGNASYVDTGICLIRSMNVYNGFFLYDDLAHITDEQGAALDGVMVQEQDVLLNITGASVARCCVVPTDVIPARVNQHVCILRCNHQKIAPLFLNRMLIGSQFQEYLWSIAEAGGGTRQAITKQQLEKLMIILPPLPLQEQFAAFVRQSDKSKFVAHQLASNLNFSSCLETRNAIRNSFK